MKNDIIRMAREAGIEEWWDSGDERWEVLLEHLERFYNLAVQHERETIAKMFGPEMELVAFAKNDQGGCLCCGFTPKMAAAAIRARGEKQ